MIDITTIGWLTTDDIVLTDGTCRMGVRGGGALYSAVGAHIWNDRVGIHSVAGRPYFDETCRLIEARGIDTSSIGISDSNGLELWLLHESEILKQQVPKLSSANALDLDVERGPIKGRHAEAKGFHLAPQGPRSALDTARSLMTSAAARPFVTMDILADSFIDASIYSEMSFLENLSAFMPSEAEIMRIWQPSDLEVWLRENAVRYGCHMVAKLGERGALVCDASTGRIDHIPAYPARVVDTTGAGDGFCGGFVAGLVAGMTPAVSAAMGTVSASYVVEACGALDTVKPLQAERSARLAHITSLTQTLS